MGKKWAVFLGLLLVDVLSVRGGDNKLTQLAKASADAALQAYESQFKLVKQGIGRGDMLYPLSISLLKRQLELDSAKEKRLSAYQAHLDRMVRWEKLVKMLPLPEHRTMVPRAFRLEAQYLLEKEKSRVNPKP
jgi:hypothetical protein